MPELPDVELFKKYLDATSLHKDITSVRVLEPRLLKGIGAQKFRNAMRGNRMIGTRRHGKHLLVHLSDETWIDMHFGMTGGLKYYRTKDEPEHTAVLFTFSTGYHLACLSRRKLGSLKLTSSPEKFIQDHDLGIDALSLNLPDFRELLARKKGAIKSLLMNQNAIAGIGNIYSDEILFQAGVLPRRPIGGLSKKDMQDIHSAMKQVLSTAVKCTADPSRMPEHFLIPHRHE
ncbi:MAG: DNA-formamidopyrimidine glycosylase family protein, partial [Desulfomonilia bacterium]